MLTIAGGIILAVVALIVGGIVLALAVSIVQGAREDGEGAGCCGVVVLLIVLGILALIFK